MNKSGRKPSRKRRRTRRRVEIIETQTDFIARHLRAAFIAARLDFSFNYAMRLYAKPGTADEFWRQVAQLALDGSFPRNQPPVFQPRSGELIQ